MKAALKSKELQPFRKQKKLLPFIKELKDKFDKVGEISLNLGFDEFDLLNRNSEILKKSLGLQELNIVYSDKYDSSASGVKTAYFSPGNPGIIIRNTK